MRGSLYNYTLGLKGMWEYIAAKEMLLKIELNNRAQCKQLNHIATFPLSNNVRIIARAFIQAYDV